MPAERKLMLDEFQAVRISFKPDGLSGVVVWRGGPMFTRPAKKGQRIRDLPPGDVVLIKGELYMVRSIESYR